MSVLFFNNKYYLRKKRLRFVFLIDWCSFRNYQKNFLQILAQYQYGYI